VNTNLTHSEKMGDWLGVAIVFGVAVLAFVLKFLIIKCCANHCRRGDSNDISWTDVEEGPSLEAFVIGDVHGVRCSGRNKGPPPKFEKALKCSTPVQHFIDLDAPPPSYEEYMKGQATLLRIASSTVQVETQVESLAAVVVQSDAAAVQCTSRMDSPVHIPKTHSITTTTLEES